MSLSLSASCPPYIFTLSDTGKFPGKSSRQNSQRQHLSFPLRDSSQPRVIKENDGIE